MKLTYIINFIISIITYYLYNQLNKIKKTINNIDTDLNNNNKLIYELNNKVDTSINNREESSYNESSDEESSNEKSSNEESSNEDNIIDNISVLNNNKQCPIQHFLNNEKKIILEFDNTNEIDYSNHVDNFIKDELSNENKLENEELSNENKLENEELSNENEELSNENEELSNENEELSNENKLDNDKLSNNELNSNININNKTELSKLKLYDLQCIAKNKNINIFYNKNNKQINKTKKLLIEEILS